VWERLKQHKVAQWTLAYAAAAYTLLHGVEMVSEALDWPHLIARILTLLLVLGVPVVITLAWYHGAKGLKRISGPELLIVTLLLFLIGSVLWYQARSASARTASVANATSPAPTAPRTSIAVMPFTNLTGDASKEYLGDGMAEEVIDTLTQVPGLKVPARTSSFAYKGRNTDIRQICRDLGVGTILEGSVRSAGNRIRITAQLINGQDGLHIWSHTYDEQFTDLFKLQDDLAKAIVQALQASMGAAVSVPATRPAPTQDVEAYNLYLQGLSVGRGTEQGFHRALDLFGQALARDPKFARAISAMATTHTAFVVLGYPLPHALEDAEQEATRALALDPTLTQAQVVVATIQTFRGEWGKAETSFSAALVQDAADPAVHVRYGAYVLQSVGRMRQALSEVAKAYRLAPADPLTVTMLATTNSIMGLDGDALRYADLALELGGSPNVTPMPQIFVNAALRKGQYMEASDRMVGTLPANLRAAGGEAMIRAAYAALADPGKRPAAAGALQSLLQKLKPEDLAVNTRKDMIDLFTQLDALDQAFELANRSLDQFALGGTVGSAWGVLWLPEMSPFRRDPRFQAFVERLRLIDYWKQYGPPDDCDLRDGNLVCH
jgi:TolB-like protein/Tfp pilus assembly protein PilF